MTNTLQNKDPKMDAGMIQHQTESKIKSIKEGIEVFNEIFFIKNSLKIFKRIIS